MLCPILTVAMPVYNAGSFLKPAVMSIVNQSFIDWELIVVDDGSTDGCFDDFPELNDPRILIIRDGENKGIVSRLNQIIDMAKGKYLARMDADDLCHPHRFEQQISELLKRPELDLVATRAYTIDKDNNITGELPFRQSHGEICSKPWLGFYMPHPSWMGKLDWFKKHRYAEPVCYLCEDQELLLRSFAQSEFLTINQYLINYRISNSINLKKIFKTRFAFFKVQLHFFIIKRNYVFLILACMVLLGRLAKDLKGKIDNKTRYKRK